MLHTVQSKQKKSYYVSPKSINKSKKYKKKSNLKIYHNDTILYSTVDGILYNSVLLIREQQGLLSEIY